MRLFVVEDSTPFRRVLLTQLSQLPNVQVIGSAATVAEAIEGIAQTAPDLLTLDLRLGRQSGVEVLVTVRAARPDVTIIVLTNHADSTCRARCLAAGANHFFDKSTEFDAAVSLIRAQAVAQPGGHS